MYPEPFVPYMWQPSTTKFVESEPLLPSTRDKRDVLYHKHRIRHNLRNALTNVRNGDSFNAQRDILAVRDNIRGFEDYLSKTIEAKFYAEFRRKNSATAAKVFAVPELLEAILLNLDPVNLMRCYEINRTFRDAIESSSKLQIRLFLKPDPNGDYRSFPFESKHISCGCMTSQCFQISFSALTGSPTTLPRIGSRWERMLIQQPPATYAHYSAVCRPSKGSSHEHTTQGQESHIIKGVGLTIGDLYDAAKPMLEQFRDCEMATYGDGKGMWRHVVMFHDFNYGRVLQEY